MLNSRKVLIFRKRLLPYSETFIADQGMNLPSYEAVFAGYKKDQSGYGLLLDSKICLLDEYARNAELEKFKIRMGFSSSLWLKKLKDVQGDVIHAHFLNEGIDGVSIKKHLDIPLITTLHGHDITKVEKGYFKSIKRNRFFECVDKVIAVSDYIYKQAVNRGCPERKLVRHYIGIDLEKFTLSKKEAESPELLFVGRLVEKKGVEYLFSALEILQKKYSDLKLTLIGDGGCKGKLERMAKEKSLNVDFVGKQSPQEIRQWMSRAWVFVAPSITAENGDAEGLGMVFLEAQALQTPVVSFRSGGVVEAVKDEVTGLLSNEKDVKGLVESIRLFIDSRSAREEYGRQGRAWVENRFDIRKQCKELERIYESVQ